jgi:hypothetical protein
VEFHVLKKLGAVLGDVGCGREEHVQQGHSCTLAPQLSARGTRLASHSPDSHLTPHCSSLPLYFKGHHFKVVHSMPSYHIYDPVSHHSCLILEHIHLPQKKLHSC